MFTTHQGPETGRDPYPMDLRHSAIDGVLMPASPPCVLRTSDVIQPLHALAPSDDGGASSIRLRAMVDEDHASRMGLREVRINLSQLHHR